jgi:hypothetical protein
LAGIIDEEPAPREWPDPDGRAGSGGRGHRRPADRAGDRAREHRRQAGGQQDEQGADQGRDTQAGHRPRPGGFVL